MTANDTPSIVERIKVSYRCHQDDKRGEDQGVANWVIK
jgi:hypothetical protein